MTMNLAREHQEETKDILSTLAFSAGFEPHGIDFDRGVWILRISTINETQLELFSQSLENHDLKHVAVEFCR